MTPVEVGLVAAGCFYGAVGVGFVLFDARNRWYARRPVRRLAAADTEADRAARERACGGLAQFEFRDVNPIPFDRSAARERVRAAIDRAALERGWTDADEAALRDLLSGAS